MLVTLGAIAPISAAGIPHLFGSKEVHSSDLHHFPKWTDMLERYRHEASSAHWDRFIDGLRDIDPLAQLDRVNRYMNDVPYKADAGNYAATDYWATPRQFFDRSGDCEDFAIAKLGVDAHGGGLQQPRPRLAENEIEGNSDGDASDQRLKGSGAFPCSPAFIGAPDESTPRVAILAPADPSTPKLMPAAPLECNDNT